MEEKFLLNKDTKDILRKIAKKFDSIEELYNQLNYDEQDKILSYHNEEGSLPHCIRWGIQACEELISVPTSRKKQ